jgi:hypothetical protein
MANAVVRYAAVAASGTLSILLAAGCDGSHTSYSHPTSTDYELSFDETHPAAESMNDVVHIYASTDSDGSVVKMYSVTLAVNGAPLYESMWHSQMGNSESLHDWVDCTASTSEIYPAIPRTISDIETSVLGPLAPPRDAKVIKPSEWQVQAGLAVMTIDQLGVSIMERVVSIGEVGSTIPGTVISDPKLSKVGTIPTFLPTWNVCKPSPQLVRPAPGRRVRVRNTPRAGQTPGGDRG